MKNGINEHTINKVSCIIPAFNEEKQIARVLDAVLAVKQEIAMEIIVIDDGSDDQTPIILKKYKNIHIITNQPNQGKSLSIAKGLEVSAGDYILMLDADLVGLRSKDILALISPIQNGTAKVTMSVRKNSFGFMRRIKLDYITGERTFPRSLIESRIEYIKKLPNFGLEVFLNDLVIKQKYPIKTVYWENVSHTLKYKKRGVYPAIKSDAKMMNDMLRTVSLISLIRQNIALIKLSVKK